MSSDFMAGFQRELTSWSEFSEVDVVNLSALAMAQAQHESSNFTSPLCTRYNNCIGYTYYSLSAWQAGPASDQPEEAGYNPYARYLNFANCGGELADWIHRRKGSFIGVNSVEQYATLMHNYKYYTAPVSEYVAGMSQYYDRPDTETLDASQPPEGAAIVASVKKVPIIYVVLAMIIGGLVYFSMRAGRGIFFRK